MYDLLSLYITASATTQLLSVK